MAEPAFMWRLFSGNDIAHFVLWGTLVVERRWGFPEKDGKVFVFDYPTADDARQMVLGGTRTYEKFGLTLREMYVIEDPESVGGLIPELCLLRTMFKADDPHLHMRTINVLNVFTVAGQALHV